MVRRGEVWLATLDSTVGSEIQKTRPCLVISPDDLHDHLRTLIVAPMTTRSRPTGFRVPIRSGGRDGFILIDQIRALDKRRLLRRLDTVPADVLDAVLLTLRKLFDPA